VLVVSHDSFNKVTGWRSAIVVPLSSSTAQSRRGPTTVLLPAGAGGLERESFALCHQVTTLDRQKLRQPIGHLFPIFLTRIDAGLRAALDLANDPQEGFDGSTGELNQP
jgi:mRNA interferase MazF